MKIEYPRSSPILLPILMLPDGVAKMDAFDTVTLFLGLSRCCADIVAPRSVFAPAANIDFLLSISVLRHSSVINQHYSSSFCCVKEAVSKPSV